MHWTTFHLTPAEVWNAQQTSATYLPEAFGADGFIHCTDGEQAVIDIGNRYYGADARPYLVLTIRCQDVGSPIKYEDPERIYPHIYGPLNVDAVIAVREIVRGDDGAFVAISD